MGFLAFLIACQTKAFLWSFFSLHWINDLPGALKQVSAKKGQSRYLQYGPHTLEFAQELTGSIRLVLRSDPPGAEAGRRVHRGDGGRRDALRAALLPPAG